MAKRLSIELQDSASLATIAKEIINALQTS